MVGAQWVVLLGYALTLTAAATWVQRDRVRLSYPVVTVVSVFFAGALAVRLAGLVTTASHYLTVLGVAGLAMFPFVGVVAYRGAPERAGPEPARIRAARTVAVGLTVLPVVSLLV